MKINFRSPYFVLLFLCLANILSGQENDGGLKKYRIAWTMDEYALRYEVVIEKEEDNDYSLVLREFTEESFILFSLPPGNYRLRVITYDFRDIPGKGTTWKNFIILATADAEPQLVMDDTSLLFPEKEEETAATEGQTEIEDETEEQTEEIAATEEQTETEEPVATEAQTEDQVEDETEAQAEDKIEDEMEVQTEAQVEDDIEVQIEDEIAAQTENQAEEPDSTPLEPAAGEAEESIASEKTDSPPAKNHDLFIGSFVEGLGYTRYSAAFGPGITFGESHNGKGLGISLLYAQDEEKFIFVEVLAHFRYYLSFLSRAKINTGLFLQAEAGVVFFAYEKFETTGHLAPVAGLSTGWRFPLGTRWYIEPSIRGGYPYIFGAGLSAGRSFD